MKFSEALELMKQGKKVKIPHWAGYWCIENDTIVMHCKDGKVLDIRKTEDVFYTIGNILSENWVVADESNSELLQGKIVQTFGFGEAIRNLKNGKRVARKGWNVKGMFLYLVSCRVVDKEFTRNEASVQPIFDYTGVAIFNAHIDMKTFDGSVCVGWLASQTDMLAEDWQVVD